MMMAEVSHIPVVQTAGLTKVFRDFWRRPRVTAVKDLNITIEPGEVFGLLGPNGSGKSTAIKMLLGLVYPTRGRIAVFGKPPTDVAVKERIGFLPEESYLYRFLNARETLDYYGRLFHQHHRVRQERIEKLLDMVGLRHEAKRRIGEYSKGMARRIGLAQALINDPEFLILDEPTSGLDPIGTRQIKDVIKELGRMGKTILLSSHLLADVEDVCDRVSILYGGQQRAAGDMESLLSQTNRTQIITEGLSEATLQQMRELLRRLERKEFISVSAPKDRLENLFLRIVAEAQAANVGTSGARGAGAMADFLGATPPGGTQLIESLVAAARKPTEESKPKPAAIPLPPAPARAVIEQLIPHRDDGKPKPVTEPAIKPAEAPAADRRVIESLIKGKPEKPS
ncbi:MAG TPA: ABC transporter ATP-binding protein [Phycisphaerae bacterium]